MQCVCVCVDITCDVEACEGLELYDGLPHGISRNDCTGAGVPNLGIEVTEL
jgi:hypothetical protein